MDVQTVKTAVVIETARHRITGNVAVPHDERLSDYVNGPSRTFFAITEATIAPISEPDRERPVEFILVNRSEAGIITPGTREEPRHDTGMDNPFWAALNQQQ